MSPHSQNIEVSVKHLKHSSNTNNYFQNSDYIQNINTFEPQQLVYDYNLGEIEEFITPDLNRSIGDETNSSNTSMDEFMNSTASNANPFDDLLSSIDTNTIKNEAYDPHFNMYINDNNLGYQQFYASNNMQQMPHTMNYDNQIYSNPPINHLNEQKNHIPSQSSQIQQHSQILSNKITLPSAPNIIDLESIKKESILEDQSESSYCSSSDAYDQMKQQYYQNNQAGSESSYKTTKQSRSYEKRYGPIVVRPRKNPAPTLASGRKSKYTVLTSDEERKREIRRSRNRQAAEKCKQKRSEIEEQLELKMKFLENEKNNLSNTQAQLNEKKLQLELYLKQHTEHCTNQAKTTNNIYTPTSTQNNSNLYSTSNHSMDNLNIEYNLMSNTNMPSTSDLIINNNTQFNHYMMPYNNNPGEPVSSSYNQIHGRQITQHQTKPLNHHHHVSYNY